MAMRSKPRGIAGSNGATSMASSVALLTVMGDDPVTDRRVAKIVSVPAARPLARPTAPIAFDRRDWPVAEAGLVPGGRDPRKVKELDMADRSARRLLLHPDVQGALEGPHASRLHLVMRHLGMRGTTSVVKFVHGAARGWRRTPMGGSGGNQFYLWWAPARTPPTEGLDLGPDDVLLRAVRHHDETDQALSTGTLSEYAEVDGQTVAASFVMNDQQRAFVHDRAKISILRGHPGAGKTTALWDAVLAMDDAPRVLYLTCSPELAEEARSWFTWIENPVRVMTFAEAMRAIVPAHDVGAKYDEEQAVRALHALVEEWRWQKQFSGGNVLSEVFCELFSTWYGRAIPVDFRGVPASAGASLGESAYRNLRRSDLPPATVDIVSRTGQRLCEHGLEGLLFPHQLRARRAIDQLRSDLGDPLPLSSHVAVPEILRADAVVVDEVQDLTLVEQFALVSLIQAMGRERGTPPRLLMAGDEAQIVRPSGFEWGILADLLADRLGRVSRHELVTNVRSPRPVVEVINRSWELYGRLSKAERPRGYAKAGAAEAVSGRIYYVPIGGSDGEGRDALVRMFKNSPVRRLLFPSFGFPDVAALSLEPAVMTSSWRAKGLDYQTAGIWNAGPLLAGIDVGARRPAAVRSTIDALRVAVSRATERLVFIDDAPRPEHAQAVRELCRDVPEFVELTPAEMIAVLQADDLDPETYAHQCCEEAERVMLNDPTRAWTMASLATSSLGRAGTAAAVGDAALRRRAASVRARAAFFHARLAPAAEAQSLLKQAAHLAADAGEDDLHVVLTHLAAGQPARPATCAAGMAEAASRAARLEAGVRTALLHDLEAWVRQAAALDLHALPDTERVALMRAAETIRAAQPETGAPLAALGNREGARFEALGRHEEALKAYLESGASADAARCLEKLDRWTEAAAQWEALGSAPDVLRCCRAVPSPSRALQVAEPLGDPSVEILRLLSTFEQMLEAGELPFTPQEMLLIERRARAQRPHEHSAGKKKRGRK